ncbi:aminotransferase [Virgisporangium aliadipatigenens]|uniref:Aminotransferase n=1 Tax=Virgisporangium aliadipatigenens TaxID=741659 RepID=A0A8J3YJ85_9ACTN|nr:aminotransferase class I/II-fold pyridoxal phosphate-dependent enzyme [Virgisporangium aliadipatigenens]GIJ45292.1 aminotransferase [Virgisporangium aliadipatigenens]
MAFDAPDSMSVRMPLEEWFDRYQYAVTSNIGESAVTSLSLADLPLSAEELWKLPLRYGHHQGLPELRAAIAAHYPGLTAEDIVVTAGAGEAIVVLATVLLNGRSRAVVEHPTYPTLYLVPRSRGASVELLRLRPDRQWRPDLEEVRASLAGGAEFFAITHPNNPTGSMISEAELRSVVAIARDAGVRLVSDETYGLMTEGEPLPPAACLDERAVSISTMSKTFGLPGIRIGWIACRDRELVRRLVACREHITITNNVLGEYIALQVQRDPGPFVARARARVAGNRTVVADVVRRHPRLGWVPPSAGVVALPWIVDATDEQAEQVYRNLAENRGTFVVPASGFELPGRYFRVGFGGEPHQLRAGLGHLVAELDALS